MDAETVIERALAETEGMSVHADRSLHGSLDDTGMLFLAVEQHYLMPERDENEEAVRNVEKATDSEPVKGEDLVESEELKKKLKKKKKRSESESEESEES